jgi:hypothetical protein
MALWVESLGPIMSSVFSEGVRSPADKLMRLAIYLLITLAFIPMSRKFKIRDQEAVHFVTFTYQFWPQHHYPIELNTNEKLALRLDYIHNNPVVAGIVRHLENYLHSGAGNYAKLSQNLMGVMLI